MLVLVHRLEVGLRSSRNGIMVVSPASVGRPWVQEEYATMVRRAVAGTQRLIPVLLGEVELPELAANRIWADFRGADGPEYRRPLDQLVAALKGERPARPAPDGQLKLPAGTQTRPEGPRRAVLRIVHGETVPSVDGEPDVGGRPAGPTDELETRLWQAERGPRVRLRDREEIVRAAEGQAVGDAPEVQQGDVMMTHYRHRQHILTFSTLN